MRINLLHILSDDMSEDVRSSVKIMLHSHSIFFLKPATSRRITSILIAFGEGWQGQYQRATLSNAVAFKAMAFTLGTPMASCLFLGFRIQRVKWGNSGSCILCLKAPSLSQILAKVPLARRGSLQMFSGGGAIDMCPKQGQKLRRSWARKSGWHTKVV